MASMMFFLMVKAKAHHLQDMWSMMAPTQSLTAGFISVNLGPLPPCLPPSAPGQTPGMNHYSYSPLPAAFPPPPGSPASLHLRLEEAGLQLRGMKKERKRVEAVLARHHPGLLKLLCTSTDFSDVNNEAVRQPPHPNHLDRLVVDSFREYSKAIALLDRMKKMQKAPQHPGISASFKGWQDSILILAELRRGLFWEVGQFPGIFMLLQSIYNQQPLPVVFCICVDSWNIQVKADVQIAEYTKTVRRAK